MMAEQSLTEEQQLKNKKTKQTNKKGAVPNPSLMRL